MTDGPYREAGAREPDEPPPDPRGPWVLQTWASALECPCCHVSLFAARKEGYRIDACGKCGGAWLAHATANRAIAERTITPADLSDEAAKHVRGAPEPGPRSCPVCTKPLEPIFVRDAQVEIDSCAEHGAWFDPHEMRAVIIALARRNPIPDDPEVDRAIEAEARRGALRPPASYDPSNNFYGHVDLLDVLSILKPNDF